MSLEYKIIRTTKNGCQYKHFCCTMLNWNQNTILIIHSSGREKTKEESLWFQLFYLLSFFLFVDRMSSFKSNDDYLILKNIGATSGVWNSDNRERGIVWYTLYYSSLPSYCFLFVLIFTFCKYLMLIKGRREREEERQKNYKNKKNWIPLNLLYPFFWTTTQNPPIPTHPLCLSRLSLFPTAIFIAMSSFV